MTYSRKYQILDYDRPREWPPPLSTLSVKRQLTGNGENNERQKRDVQQTSLEHSIAIIHSYYTHSVYCVRSPVRESLLRARDAHLFLKYI